MDNWYTVTVPSTGAVVIEMTDAGGPTDWAMEVYTFTGSCADLTQLECDDDDGDDFFPLVDLTGLTPNDILYVRVWEYVNNDTGPFNICAHTILPPPNDACVDAIALTNASGMPTAASGATYNSTAADPAESSPAVECSGFTGDAGDDIWFEVTAPNGAGDLITVEVAGVPDMVVTLFSGTCGSLTAVACADDVTDNSTETITYLVPASRSAAAETFVVQVFTAGAGGGEFTVSSSAALPVELVSFDGQAMEKTNKLTWATAREDAADRYQVERSSTATSNWSVIGEVDAVGNSETESRYELIDESPLANAFYRLRMVDQDGTSTFSDIVELANASLRSSDLSVFPIPAINEVTVSFEAQAEGKANITLTDLTGRTISEQVMDVTTGQNLKTINLQRRAPGIYLVRVNVDGTQMTQRVIKR
jgi:hypothetical protein